MDKLTNNELEEYLSSLPEPILVVLKDKNWRKRLMEISAKYSLSEEQSIILQNLVLFLIIAVESPDTFEESIRKELNISNLLAEQIVKDVDERVFQYVINIISEEKTKNTLVKPPLPNEKEPEPKIEEARTDFDALRTMSKDIEYIKNGQDPVLHNSVTKEEPKTEVLEKIIENKLPEIKPEILPEIRKEKIDTTPHNLPGMEIGEIKKEEKTIPDVKIDDLGDNKVFMGSEFMQKTQEINNIPQNNPAPETPKIPNNVNYTPKQPEQVTPKVEEKKIDVSVPKYTVDPYREPIE